MPTRENPLKIVLRRLLILRNFLLTGAKVTFSEPYWTNRTIFRVNLLSAAANGFTWAYLFAKRISGGYTVILHYNLFFGVDMQGPYDRIYMLPLTGLALFAINAALALFFYKIERIASYLLTLNILIIQLLLLLSSYLIIRANG